MLPAANPPVFPDPMTGQELLIALGRTKRRVKLILPNQAIEQIDPTAALNTVKSGCRPGFHWRGSGGKHRVRAIEQVPVPLAARAAIWQRCYRTDGAPVLQPSIEWLREVTA